MAVQLEAYCEPETAKGGAIIAILVTRHSGRRARGRV